MSSNSRILKKSYAMQRMARAIERAVRAGSGKEKQRAARWVAAWGMLCGIRSDTVRLRRSDVAQVADDHARKPSDPIEIPADVQAPAIVSADFDNRSLAGPPSSLPFPGDGGEGSMATEIVDPESPE